MNEFVQDFQKVIKTFDHNRSTPGEDVRSLRWQLSQNCRGFAKSFLGSTVLGLASCCKQGPARA
jgi:hypothetical protein